MKVIFLDFDGVLNSADFRESVADYYSEFIDESRMPLLRKLVELTGAEIVLTTTWRHHWFKDNTDCNNDTEKINKIFGKYGLQIYNKTGSYNENRNFEISMFLCCNNVENYVIIDDVDFNWSEENRRHFVKTDDSGQGLDEKSVRQAVEILGLKSDN